MLFGRSSPICKLLSIISESSSVTSMAKESTPIVPKPPPGIPNWLKRTLAWNSKVLKKSFIHLGCLSSSSPRNTSRTGASDKMVFATFSIVEPSPQSSFKSGSIEGILKCTVTSPEFVVNWSISNLATATALLQAGSKMVQLNASDW
ncbi:hypothetical protein OGAPHI_000861 [Ogataea philodendri]|uniref:Uncharacterized protein n=1 Tax=Ogataea philodendri TaxID=1378263 RepID=A0A9P8TAA9_9ASCO|nr:uncharacterized protein OGAPHI_000861 [Ogataea philodendri]KAH3671150.1 hypothetical protein OGAPHI_000861 [Ogataea philodendri]